MNDTQMQNLDELNEVTESNVNFWFRFKVTLLQIFKCDEF